MDIDDFDPTAPLPGPPDPWASTDTPVRRDGPPFHMTEMIAAEPAIIERIVGTGAANGSPHARLAEEIRRSIGAGQTVILTGCGTSEHGALAAAEIIGAAVRAADIRPPGATARLPVVAEQAFELAQDPPSSGLVIGISHEGATGATNAALTAARAAGASTAIVTVSDRSPGAGIVDRVVTTGELDQSWCHTVGYLSPIAAAVAVAGHLTAAPIDPSTARSMVAAGLQDDAVAAASAIAGGLGEVERVLVIASGADRSAGRELVLKIEEGTWLPAAYRDLETFLHGHLAATDPATALIVIAADRAAGDVRGARIRGALAAANVIGMPTAAIVSAAMDARIPADATSLGRIVVPDAPDAVPDAAAALLMTATPLQTLTERLARARGIDPDPIHRDVDRYRAAADAADASD